MLVSRGALVGQLYDASRILAPNHPTGFNADRQGICGTPHGGFGFSQTTLFPQKSNGNELSLWLCRQAIANSLAPTCR
jgi:hypothetical protein